VTTMTHMFEAAKAFNRDLSSWDTKNAKHMRQMFKGAEAFDQNNEPGLGIWMNESKH